jgi:histone arginine demethylase JMJD6
LDGRTLTKDDFATHYEANEIPVIIRGIPDGHEGGREGEGGSGGVAFNRETPWRAKRRWLLETLMWQEEVGRPRDFDSGGRRRGADSKNNNHRRDGESRGDGDVCDLRDRKFKCGEDDDGHSVKVKLRHFLEYLRWNRDDSPLYVFDSGFDDDPVARSLLEDYRVPTYFDDDLFRLVSESRRAPYRWFLVGPERSGTCVHVDPLATNAWNTLIEGRKRWVLFPPHVPKSVVKGRGLVEKDEDDEAIHYFMYILPRIKKKAMAYRDDPRYRDFACYEFTQNPGETVFVPNGWWHAVLNLTHTVGVTQNYCSPRNFDKVWMQTRSGRKRMAWKWLQALDSHHPELARRARHLNERDGFRMKYDPAEIDRRRRQAAATPWEAGAANSPPAAFRFKQPNTV